MRITSLFFIMLSRMAADLAAKKNQCTCVGVVDLLLVRCLLYCSHRFDSSVLHPDDFGFCWHDVGLVYIYILSIVNII